MCLFEVSVRKANAEISAELDGCTSDCAVLLRSRRTKRGGITRGDDTYLCECRLSSPRATDSFVENALYTSGGRNTGADRKDGAILFCGFRYTYKKINYKNGGFLFTFCFDKKKIRNGCGFCAV